MTLKNNKFILSKIQIVLLIKIHFLLLFQFLEDHHSPSFNNYLLPIYRQTIYTLLTHLTPTFSGFLICNNKTITLSFTTLITLSFAFSSVSPSSRTISTRSLLNNATMAATNSTWLNFLPGHARIESDHGWYDPLGGVQIYSRSTGDERVSSALVKTQRWGLQE